MAPYQVAATAIRLFAIWLLIYSVRTATALFAQLRAFDDATVWAIAIAIEVAIVAFVVVLWFFPRSIVRVLVPGILSPEPVASSANDWFTVGCSLLGLWALSLAISGLVHYLVVLYLSQRSPGELQFDPERHAYAISALALFCIGVWLLLGARGLKRLLLWARRAGPE